MTDSQAHSGAHDGSTPSTPLPEPKHEFTDSLYGWITHTDMASLDPAATKA